MIAYRIQDEARSLADLLASDTQYSHAMTDDDEKIRRGVSGMRTLPELAAYIATSSIIAERPVIIRIEGPESPDTGLDADKGEILLLPTTATQIDDGDFFDVVGDLVDLHYEQGMDFHDLVEVAEARL